jgi:hypothetical protein
MSSAGRDKTCRVISRGISQMVEHSDDVVEFLGDLLQCLEFLRFPRIIFNRATDGRRRRRAAGTVTEPPALSAG